ncbi:GEVED domain-containing protein [Chitinophagaceae bacterium MMS25-I14]
MKRIYSGALLCVLVMLCVTRSFGQSVTVTGNNTNVSQQFFTKANFAFPTGTTGIASWSSANSYVLDGYWTPTFTGGNNTQTSDLSFDLTNFPGFTANTPATFNVALVTKSGTSVTDFNSPAATATAYTKTGNVITFAGVTTRSGGTARSFTLIFNYSISASPANAAPANYSTAPSSYTAVSHAGLSNTLALGSIVTRSFAGVNNTSKQANDGFVLGYLPPVTYAQTSYTATIKVLNNTGASKTLWGWIDFNLDGAFQSAEAASVSVASSASVQNIPLTWNSLSLTKVGQGWARFRITSTALTAATPGSNASDGEVEDYKIAISDNKNCGTYNTTYITGDGTIGISSIASGGSGGFTDFKTGASGVNEFGSNNDDNLYYYGGNNSFYWYDPITNTEGTLVSDVASLGTAAFPNTSSGSLSESAGFYYNGRMYFTLDNTTNGTSHASYFYSFDIAPGGKSIVPNSLRTYGDIQSDDHGDFVITNESSLPVIYDIGGDGGSNVSFRKVTNLPALEGTVVDMPGGNVSTFNVTGGTLLNAQMAYNPTDGKFYISQNSDMYTLVPSGTNAALALLRSSAFSGLPFDMGNNICVSDLGDAPDTYNTLYANSGPQHAIFNTVVRFGTTVTSDEDGQPGAAATSDVDDGHPTYPSYTGNGNIYNTSIRYSKTTTTAKAYIFGWIDFNGNGVFDAAERSNPTVVPAATSASNLNITVTYPNTHTNLTGSLINKMSRFRISTDSTAVTVPTGYASDGEVEDWLISSLGGPLSVELISFDAEPQNNTSVLNWTTAAEKNSDHFEIEYSTNGKTFTQVGSVKSQGTTELTSTYQFVHTKPQSGLNYYRLRMVDLDGTAQYTEVRTVRIGNLNSGHIIIQPNPTSGNTQLVLPAALSEKGGVVVYNSVGTVVYKADAANQQSVQINLSGFAAGLYHVIIMDGDNAVYRDKIILQ